MLECCDFPKVEKQLYWEIICSMGFSFRFVTYYQITYGALHLTFISSHNCHRIRYKTLIQTFSCDVQFVIQKVSRIVVKFHFHY